MAIRQLLLKPTNSIHRIPVKALWITSLLFIASQGFPAAPDPPVIPVATTEYRIIGWNDLGMHCMNENFEHLCILPPFNTVHAQVLKTGAVPELMPMGVSVEFSVEGNTYSVGKTDFWDWEDKLFGVNLAPDFGLAGNTLSGQMGRSIHTFVAEGIPLTPFLDAAPTTLYPYQIVLLIARELGSGRELCRTCPVAPVSTEIRCSICHVDGLEDIATGNVETNILTLHDKENGTHLMDSRPVLCASCHGSNALGAPGNPELPNLSRALHHKHAPEPGEPGEGTNDCYACHPGQETQCHRGVMYTRGMRCIDCHGDMDQVAAEQRRPWIDEPRCGAANCHGSQFAEEPGKLYRNSRGHGGMFCTACHGSPHAIWPSNEANDNIQTIALQGHAGTLSDCRVCHQSIPVGPGPHGITIVFPTQTETSTPQATLTPTPMGSMNAVKLLAMLQTMQSEGQPGPILFEVSNHWME